MRRVHAVRLTMLIIMTSTLWFYWPRSVQIIDDNDLEYVSSRISQGLRDHPDILIANIAEQQFSWEQWLDISSVPTSTESLQELDPKLFPYLSNLATPEDAAFPIEHITSQAEHALLAMIYTRYFMPAPRQILKISKLRTLYTILALPGRAHRQFGLSPGCYPEPRSPRNENVWETHDLPDEMFIWDPDAVVIAEEALASNSIAPEPNTHQDMDDCAVNSSDQEGHAITLREALSEVKHSTKHFHEPKLGYMLGDHYDWRFFRQVGDLSTRQANIRRIAQTWNLFTREENIVTWYAHGSLVGWFWNGLTLPWDTDNDVQMPIMEMDRLARDYNGTLVVVDDGAYLVDVGPWYVDRTIKSKEYNIIDARFIDISTGLYIDITALALNVTKKGYVSCKQPHNYRISDLSPLRATLFEGTPALVPRNVRSILRKEYKYFERPTYLSWTFNHLLRLWTSDEPCEQYINKMEVGIPSMCPFYEEIPDCDYESWGTCNRATMEEYEATRDWTSWHEVELKEISEGKPKPQR